MSKYQTVQGDTWDLISFKIYGDERYMTNLIEANPLHVNTLVFGGGVELEYPTISIEEKVSDNLPPWKK